MAALSDQLGLAGRSLLRWSAWLDAQCGLAIAEEERASLRQAQAARYSEALPTILGANMVFGLTISAVLLWSGWLVFPLLWAPPIVALSGLGIRRMGLLRARARQAEPPSPRFTVRIIRDSCLLAMPWAILAVAFNPGAAPRLDGIIGITITGLSCVGVFTMAILPAAALAFLATLWAGRLTHLAFLQGDMLVLYLAVDLIFLVLSLLLARSVARRFLDRMRAETEIATLREAERRHATREQATRLALEGRVETFHGAVKTALSSLSDSIDQMNGSADRLSSLSRTSRSGVAEFPEMVDRARLGLKHVDDESHRMTDAVSSIRAGADHTSGFVQIAAENVRRSVLIKQRLVQLLDEVDKGTNLIRDIARQTNLVALNATIEAARAGQLGTGFSVVAHEVKLLSGRTNEAAELIITQVHEIRTAAKQSIAASHEIETAAHSVIDSAETILTASDQQADALDKIVAALGDAVIAAEAVAQATAIVTAGSEGALDQACSVAETAKRIQATARILNDTVDAFSQLVVRL